MTFKELALYVAEKYNVPKNMANNWTYAVIDALFDAIVDEEEVNLYGYGSFRHATYKPLHNTFTAKDFKNIDYNLEWEIPSRVCVKFTPSARIKMAVRNGIKSEDLRGVREGCDDYPADVTSKILPTENEED